MQGQHLMVRAGGPRHAPTPSLTCRAWIHPGRLASSQIETPTCLWKPHTIGPAPHLPRIQGQSSFIASARIYLHLPMRLTHTFHPLRYARQAFFLSGRGNDRAGGCRCSVDISASVSGSKPCQRHLEYLNLEFASALLILSANCPNLHLIGKALHHGRANRRVPARNHPDVHTRRERASSGPGIDTHASSYQSSRRPTELVSVAKVLACIPGVVRDCSDGRDVQRRWSRW